MHQNQSHHCLDSSEFCWVYLDRGKQLSAWSSAHSCVCAPQSASHWLAGSCRCTATPSERTQVTSYMLTELPYVYKWHKLYFLVSTYFRLALSINTVSVHLSLSHTGITGDFTSHRSTLRGRAGRREDVHFEYQSTANLEGWLNHIVESGSISMSCKYYSRKYVSSLRWT